MAKGAVVVDPGLVQQIPVGEIYAKKESGQGTL